MVTKLSDRKEREAEAYRNPPSNDASVSPEQLIRDLGVTVEKKQAEKV